MKLAERLDAGFSVYLQFVTNKSFDINAKEFLELNAERMEGLGFSDIYKRYTYVAEEDVHLGPSSLSIPNSSKIAYDLSTGISVSVRIIPVLELLKLDGIQDRRLFNRNVRYSLGSTRVNKDIKRTILARTQHQR